MIIQKQKGVYDCFLACVSMAVQRDYDELFPSDFLQRIEEAKGCHGDVCDEALGLAGLAKGVDYWTVYVPNYFNAIPSVRQLLRGRRALLQVPSLNYEGMQHIVYWSGRALYDPSSKQVYQWLDQLAPAYAWAFNEVKEDS